MERSLIIVKPDAVQRGLIGEVLRRLEQRGLRFVGLKLMWVDRELAERHYAEHRGKPFFEELLSFITSGPVVVGVVEGPRAIEVTRKTMGKTDP
ncbi:MAG: nucleoside-diphosphate kinase, partial [Thermomicrobium sp.]|nr:nucleoside-diphosphate kinase [Thermomicrobium sp.]